MCSSECFVGDEGYCDDDGWRDESDNMHQQFTEQDRSVGLHGVTAVTEYRLWFEKTVFDECIQGVFKVKVKVKGHLILALLCWHENRFYSQANSRIATKLAYDDLAGNRVLIVMLSLKFPKN